MRSRTFVIAFKSRKCLINNMSLEIEKIKKRIENNEKRLKNLDNPLDAKSINAAIEKDKKILEELESQS